MKRLLCIYLWSISMPCFAAPVSDVQFNANICNKDPAATLGVCFFNKTNRTIAGNQLHLIEVQKIYGESQGEGIYFSSFAANRYIVLQSSASTMKKKRITQLTYYITDANFESIGCSFVWDTNAPPARSLPIFIIEKINNTYKCEESSLAPDDVDDISISIN